VGEFWQDLKETEELVWSLGLKDRVEIVPGYVSDQDAAEYFERCDAVILPYRSASASGVVALAYWLERPVIVSDLPSFRDLVRDNDTGWKFPTGDVQELAGLLNGPVSRESSLAMRPKIIEAKQDLSWHRFVDTIFEDCIA
jgi:D-inositol-3-phosphate glycosyltransferase